MEGRKASRDRHLPEKDAPLHPLARVLLSDEPRRERVPCRCGATLGEAEVSWGLSADIVLADDLVPLPSQGGMPRYGPSRRVKQMGALQYRRRPVTRQAPVKLSVPAHVLIYCPVCGKRSTIRMRYDLSPLPPGALGPPRSLVVAWEIE